MCLKFDAALCYVDDCPEWFKYTFKDIQMWSMWQGICNKYKSEGTEQEMKFIE